MTYRSQQNEITARVNYKSLGPNDISLGANDIAFRANDKSHWT